MTPVDIFILERDPITAGEMRRALDPLLNRVDVFHDPERAVDYLLSRGEFDGNRRTPELIILDADLLGAECWQFLERLNRMDRYQASDVVVVSRDATMGDVMRARRAGAGRIEGKPVDANTLLRLVAGREGVDMAVLSTVADRLKHEQGRAL